MLDRIRYIAKKNPFFYRCYQTARECCKQAVAYTRRQGRYTFENRSNNSEKLCIVLAGYKPYLYPAVFGRIARYAPADMDMCICSSGSYAEELSALCREHGWSYLSTKKNNVSLIQNIAIHLHPHAEYIYKLDEDIFITENYFEHLLAAYKHAEQGNYIPGALAPLIPVNGYGNCRVLEKLGLTAEFEKRFERPKYQMGAFREIEKNPEAVKFIWGEGGFVPSIDEMNARFAADPPEERPCAIRFSIGAILFKRSLWQEMRCFPLGWRNGMGCDETALCAWCCLSSQPLMVSENVVAGHLSFGPVNNEMKEYFLSHKDQFMAK